MKKFGLVGLAVLIVVLVLAIVQRPGWFGIGGEEKQELELLASPEVLETMRTALAETENLNPNAAEGLWLETLNLRPGDTDALQNLIVARISRLSQLRSQLNDVAVAAEEKSAIESLFPAYETDTREAIEQLRTAAATTEDSRLLVAAEWFSGRLDSITADSNINADIRGQLNQTIDRLTESLQANPEAAPLVGLIDELSQLASDPIEGLSADRASKILPALDAASEANPRNLYIVSTGLQFAIVAESPLAAKFALRLQELSQPIVELIRKDAGGFDLETLGKQIGDFVDAREWRRAQSLQRPWMNLLRGTEMMKVDRRRANPNVLDFVATGSISRMARQLASESEMPNASSPLVFASAVALETGLENPVAIAKVDFDLLDEPEIAAASDDQLVVMQKGDDGWFAAATKSLKSGVRGLIQAELFPADASDPLRIKRPTSAPGDPDAASESELANLAKAHNTYPGLIVWGTQGIELIRFDGRPNIEPEMRLLDSPRESGMESLRDVLAVQPADIDADGDLDLVVSSASNGISIWINRGDLTFFSVGQFSQLPDATDPVVAMAIGDLDRDLDIDVAAMQKSGQLGWLENLLHLQMRWSPVEGAALDSGESADVAEGIEAAGVGKGVAVLEWDGNVSWDLAYSGSESLAVLTTQTTGIGATQLLENQVVVQDSAEKQRVSGKLLVSDLESDSWPDLITFGADGVSVVRGGARELTKLETVKLLDDDTKDLVTGDFTGNGKIDLFAITDAGVVLLENVSDTGHYVNVQMKGIDDNATGRVNHFAIGSTLELRFGPHYRAQIITDRTTHFGLGNLTEADTLRAVLTNGITQNIISPPIDSVVIEEQTLKGSCPYLYAWDGEKYAFVTDCLWAAPLGLQYAVGKVIPDRPWEYLKVDGRFLQPKEGKYEIRLTEELWELAYFDHVSLIAVDHPADVEIWTNEKVGPPDSVQPKVFTVRETSDVVSARSSRGDDCTDLLKSRDEQYVQGFDRRLRQGLCPVHWIELELPEIEKDDRVLLLLTGWIMPTDTSLNIQIDQNPELPAVEPPSLWIPGDGVNGDGVNGDGGVAGAGSEWVCSIPAMGFPGGKTKTIVVDVTGKLNLEDRRVRVQTSAQIYWDAAKVAVNPPDVEIVSTPLNMLSAEIDYRGFSAILPRTSQQPHRYDFHSVNRDAKWPPLAGKLTRPGDCLQLLAEWDDEMVVMGGGDEIRIEFEAPAGELPDGWKRGFILHSVGWDKDADLNTLEGQNVGPLPFREMTAYPPVGVDAEKLREVEQKNAWHRTREQPFRNFWQK